MLFYSMCMVRSQWQVTCVCVCVCVCERERECRCVHVGMSVYILLCVWMCMCVCICVSGTHTHTHARTHPEVGMVCMAHTNTLSYKCVVVTHTYSHADKRTLTHACMWQLVEFRNTQNTHVFHMNCFLRSIVWLVFVHVCPLCSLMCVRLECMREFSGYSCGVSVVVLLPWVTAHHSHSLALSLSLSLSLPPSLPPPLSLSLSISGPYGVGMFVY